MIGYGTVPAFSSVNDHFFPLLLREHSSDIATCLYKDSQMTFCKKEWKNQCSTGLPILTFSPNASRAQKHCNLHFQEVCPLCENPTLFSTSPFIYILHTVARASTHSYLHMAAIYLWNVPNRCSPSLLPPLV